MILKPALPRRSGRVNDVSSGAFLARTKINERVSVSKSVSRKTLHQNTFRKTWLAETCERECVSGPNQEARNFPIISEVVLRNFSKKPYPQWIKNGITIWTWLSRHRCNENNKHLMAHRGTGNHHHTKPECYPRPRPFEICRGR